MGKCEKCQKVWERFIKRMNSEKLKGFVDFVFRRGIQSTTPAKHEGPLYICIFFCLLKVTNPKKFQYVLGFLS